MVMFQLLIQRQDGAVDFGDEAFFGENGSCPPIRPARATRFVFTRGSRDDDAIAGAPASDTFCQCHSPRTLASGGTELDPGAAQRSAMEVHASAAANDGRTRFLVHSVQ